MILIASDLFDLRFPCKGHARNIPYAIVPSDPYGLRRVGLGRQANIVLALTLVKDK